MAAMLGYEWIAKNPPLPVRVWWRRAALNMHETGIALEIFRSALESATEQVGAGVRLLAVRASIGERTAVDPSLLDSAWQSIVIGTRHDGADLQVRWCPTRRFCASCNQATVESMDRWQAICPDCGDVIQTEGGQELELNSVEFKQIPSPPLSRRSSALTAAQSHA
jgi:hydrogenase nickel incorporation protein HypA/HybF